jgi:uncharacterized membrane protein (UPF0182 family)
MNRKLIIGFFALLALVLLWTGISIYPEWLWFENLNFSPVFWTMLLSKFGFGLVIWLLLILIITTNLYAAKRLSATPRQGAGPREGADYFSQIGISTNTSNILLIAFVLIGGFIIASQGSGQWDMVLRYLYQKPFGDTDPIFGRDIGFYIFSLPLYVFILNGLFFLILLAGLLTVVWYLKDGALQIIDESVQGEEKPLSLPKITISLHAKKHLLFLAGIIALLLAWGYYLKIYGLLYSTQGPAFGASYTDVHIKVLANRILIIVSVAFAFMLFLNIFRFRLKWVWISGAIWLGAVLLLADILPIVVQKLVVKPNELAREMPYIAYNIDHTRKAYHLNKIETVDFPVNDQLSREDIERESVTIQNIRIWDERPLLQTYRQIQGIRLYYDFNNVDVDRYIIDKQYRQVMLAAREMVVNQLPPQANTWVNRHLTYTHGYGLACNPVNEVTREGLPRLFIKDLPPSFEMDLKVERPEIYYGERTNEYVLVKTKANEFDYPKGDKNVYTTYEGKGGVDIKSFLRRLLFAIEFLDPQILFTTYLSPQSRIMYKRRIDRRVRSIAPFLDYDSDPYMVVSEGRLYWIIDAYTTSNMYPYSSRSSERLKDKRLNYIRNSVKVVIDAYHGDVSFYIIDEDDPIVKTYLNIFPDLFKPFGQMPADLKKHIRYPKDLFEIQAGTYRSYHMEDPQVFYNQEDLWQVPDELYGDSRQEMKPYYIIVKLPEEDKEEFLLMLPFTPSKKDNMIGWLAARSDLPNYGNLLAYKLPKEKLVYGPMQIEARVDQQTEISRELSLWDQRGSRVIRGNLLAIPVSGAFIYVEPVYLQAKQEEAENLPTEPPPRGLLGGSRSRQISGPGGVDRSRAAALPELKRVIVALGNRLLMEENLDKALRGLLGGETTPKEVASPPISQTQDIYDLGSLALEHYNKAKDYLRQANWALYGKELEDLENILRQMSEMKKQD